MRCHIHGLKLNELHKSNPLWSIPSPQHTIATYSQAERVIDAAPQKSNRASEVKRIASGFPLTFTTPLMFWRCKGIGIVTAVQRRSFSSLSSWMQIHQRRLPDSNLAGVVSRWCSQVTGRRRKRTRTYDLRMAEASIFISRAPLSEQFWDSWSGEMSSLALQRQSERRGGVSRCCSAWCGNWPNYDSQGN